MTNSEPDENRPSAVPRSSIGRLFGKRYRIDRELGSGGLGTVFVARHATLDRDVAVKLMRDDIAARPEYRERFEREARALAQLRHPNIVTVLDFGVEEDTSFLVMELAEGRTLDVFVAEEKPNLELAIAIVRQLLRALAYAHGQKIIHRDLKPANLIVRKLTETSVHVVVLDFGLAKIVDDGNPALTQKGAILGTPAYMAPEQASGGTAKPSLDVYAAGLIAFETFTGRRPFLETDRGALLRSQVATPPPMPSSIRSELTEIAGLDAFLLRALEKKPTNRFADAGQMLEAFERIVGVGTASESRSLPRAASSPDLSPFLPASAPGIAQGALDTAVKAAPRASSTPSTQLGAAPAPPAPRISPTAASTASRAPTVIGISILGFVGLGMIALGAWAYIGRDAPPAPAVPTITLPQLALPPAGEGASPLDRGVPSELEVLHRTILAGGVPSRNALQDLYRYNTTHPDDARGLLLLGRTATDRRWFSDATDAYEAACEREPASSTDPRLREDLVRFARLDRFGPKAADVLVRCVGAPAVPAVEAAIEAAESDDQRGRLEALLRRLRRIR